MKISDCKSGGLGCISNSYIRKGNSFRRRGGELKKNIPCAFICFVTET